MVVWWTLMVPCYYMYVILTTLVVILQQCKKTEIRQKIEQVRNGVTDFTNSIEGMRITRDSKNSAIDRLQKEIIVSNRPSMKQ